MKKSQLDKTAALCQGCLSAGRLYNLHSYGLSQLYKQLIGSEISDESQSYLMCHICCTLLHKYAAFRRRCRQVVEILQSASKSKINTSSILPYTCTKVNIISYPEVDFPEPTAESNETDETIFDTDNVSDNVTDENGIKIENDLVSIKEEDSYVHTEELFLMDVLVDEKEVEVNKRKVKKRKLLTVKKKKPKSCMNSCLLDLTDNENKGPILKEGKVTVNRKKEKQNIEVESDREERPKFKQKGKYFETQDNIANFERLYNVDVIVLNKEQQMKEVVERKNGFDYPFRCNDCYKGFMDGDNLDKHQKALHDPSRGDAVCDICKIRYSDSRNLNRHLRSHRLKFACRQCKTVSRNTCKAVEHYKMHVGKMYTCDHCAKEYLKLTTYLTHIRIRHPSELIWCDVCGDSSISQFGLNAHKNLAHKELVFPPDCQCITCGMRFINPDALQHHKSEEQDCGGRRACPHCGRSFPDGLLLKDHLLTTHKNVDRKTLYPCAKCEKVFPKYNLYSAHYRRIHVDKDKGDLKTVICELCGKAMRNTCELRYHQRSHTGEKPFQCPSCPKKFVKRALMMTHMRVHSNERPFVCKHCPKTFKGPAALRGHQYVHTGEKPPTQRRKRTNLIS